MEIQFHTTTQAFRKSIPKRYHSFLANGLVYGYTGENHGDVHINLPVINFSFQRASQRRLIKEVCDVVHHESLHSVIHNEHGFHPEWVVRSMTGERFTDAEKEKYKTIRQ